MSDKLFIDSNIFLYAFSNLYLAKQTIAKGIVLKTSCVISTQVINEVGSNLLKKLKLNEAQVIGFAEDCYARYSIVNFSKILFLSASELRSIHRLSYYDSLIVAAALEAGCNTLFSEDMAHMQLLGGRIRVVNPFVSIDSLPLP